MNNYDRKTYQLLYPKNKWMKFSYIFLYLFNIVVGILTLPSRYGYSVLILFTVFAICFVLYMRRLKREYEQDSQKR